LAIDCAERTQGRTGGPGLVPRSSSPRAPCRSPNGSIGTRACCFSVHDRPSPADSERRSARGDRLTATGRGSGRSRRKGEATPKGADHEQALASNKSNTVAVSDAPKGADHERKIAFPTASV